MGRKTVKDKWRFAIGTTSRVPHSGGVLHYLIADFDNHWPKEAVEYINETCEQAVLQKTPHGWHLYTNRIITFDGMDKVLHSIGADPVWIEIGKKRGYYFLADKDRINFSWEVEHMAIFYGKEKT